METHFFLFSDETFLSKMSIIILKTVHGLLWSTSIIIDATVLHKCGHAIVGLAVSSVRHFFLPQVGEKANVLYSVLVEPGARGR